MPELMLKPGWPNVFRRTVTVGKKSRLIVFPPREPVEVSDAELKALKGDIGLSIFEIERDEKNRPRFIEHEAASDPAPDPNEKVNADHVAHV